MRETRNEPGPAGRVYPYENRTCKESVYDGIYLSVCICQVLIVYVQSRLTGNSLHRHERSALRILPAPYGMHGVTHFSEGIFELLAALVTGHLLHRSEIERILRDLVISVLHQEGIVIKIPASGKIHISKCIIIRCIVLLGAI